MMLLRKTPTFLMWNTLWPGIPDSYQKLPESDSGTFRYTRPLDYQTPSRSPKTNLWINKLQCWYFFAVNTTGQTGRDSTATPVIRPARRTSIGLITDHTVRRLSRRLLVWPHDSHFTPCPSSTVFRDGICITLHFSILNTSQSCADIMLKDSDYHKICYCLFTFTPT